jgi:hypothetical protein
MAPGRDHWQTLSTVFEFLTSEYTRELFDFKKCFAVGDGDMEAAERRGGDRPSLHAFREMLAEPWM